MVKQTSHHRAAAVLNAGGIISHYTDTIVGFACLPQSLLLARLNRIKQRQNKQGFILLASDVEQLAPFIVCSAEDKAILADIQNKPTTWIVNAATSVPDALKNEQQQLAVRVTQDKNVFAITEHTGAIVSTSANLSGNTPCKTPEEVRQQFASQIDYIMKSDNFGSGQASTIIDLSTRNILRH